MFMKKAVKKSKKKMTLDILAEKIGEVASSVKVLENKIGQVESSVDNLAIMTQGQFERIDQRFEKVENRLENIESGQKKIHQEVLNVHDTFVKRSEFDNVVQRLVRVEQKLKTKSK